MNSILLTPSQTDRRILAVVTDTHAGMQFALMNPETILYTTDERGNYVPYTPRLTSPQEYLWRYYLSCIEDMKTIADGSPILALHLGDECNGNKHPDMLVSNRMSDQVIIADYNARPMLELENLFAYRQVVGTDAHNFGFGSSAFMLVSTLQARYPRVDIRPLYHSLLNYAGVTVDYAHHGPGPGSRDWLRGNIARLYLRSIMTVAQKNQEQPPRLVLRGHYHTPVYELLKDNGYTSEIHVLPSFTMFSDHAIQATSSESMITHGLLVFEIEHGEITKTHELYQKIDVRTNEDIL